MKVWVTRLGKSPKSAKVIPVDEKYLKWMMEDRVNTSHCPLVTGNTDLILFLTVYMEVMELLPNPARSGSVWCKRYSYRNVLFAIPLRELADSQLTESQLRGPRCHPSGLTTAICCKARLVWGCSLPLAEPREASSAEPVLHNMGLLWQAICIPEHPNNLVQPLQSEAPRQGRVLRPSCSPAPEVKPTVQMEGSTCLLLVLLFMLQRQSPPGNLSQVFCRHLLLDGFKSTQKLMFMDQYIFFETTPKLTAV